ncbi:TadE/TadG family type IV pilus assembly protein [Micromonospora sp. NPDC092111]|uniref:TadE/TadG family type IV pilus assembly protein n=1 Tax=Micromonospora sp. NPDC092111 TaxID=3364289 RepID=UPI00380A3E15
MNLHLGRRSGRRRRQSTDRGSVTTEVVLYAPLLFLLVLLGVQLALWALAQLGVQHAANHALQTTRVDGGTAAAGHDDATAVLDQVADRVVTDARVSVDRTTDTATVAVSGRATAVLPWLRLPVSTQVNAPVERFRPDTD